MSTVTLDIADLILDKSEEPEYLGEEPPTGSSENI